MIYYKVEENWGSGGMGIIYNTLNDVRKHVKEYFDEETANAVIDWCNQPSNMNSVYKVAGLTVYMYSENFITDLKRFLTKSERSVDN